jgi:hypothetical protein
MQRRGRGAQLFDFANRSSDNLPFAEGSFINEIVSGDREAG